MVDRAKTTHVEINLRSRQNSDIKLHAARQGQRHAIYCRQRRNAACRH